VPAHRKSGNRFPERRKRAEGKKAHTLPRHRFDRTGRIGHDYLPGVTCNPRSPAAECRYSWLPWW